MDLHNLLMSQSPVQELCKHKDWLEKSLDQRILLMDGAMGTMIQRHQLHEEDFRGKVFADHPQAIKGNHDALCLSQGPLIRDIHCLFLEAGADIIGTNSFNANALSQADYGMESQVRAINYAAAQRAREAAEQFSSPERPRLVAGAIGPTNKALSLSPDLNDPAFRAVDFDSVAAAYKEQAEALIDGGVDLLLVETIFDTLNAKAALFAIQELFYEKHISMPIMISATIVDQSGRTLSGQTPAAFWISVAHMPYLLSVGLNCALGSAQMRPFLTELAQAASTHISLYPNAGLPNEMGEYDESPQFMQKHIRAYAEESLLNVVGGCCGTTPDHIRAIADVLASLKPRPKFHQSKPFLSLSGLDAFLSNEESNFINIGERNNITGSKKFARLILNEQYDEALSIALQQIEDGAQIIDVNMDEGMLDSNKAMERFLRLMNSEPDIARVPVMIDSSQFHVIEKGLQNLQGKCIVNSISLKEGEELFCRQALRVRRYGAALVVMAFDEEGQADSLERRISVCKRSYEILTQKLAFPPQDIIFDPNILTVATGMDEHKNYAVDFIEAVRWIKNSLPYAKTSGGISNISFSFRGNNKLREAMHTVFLYHAIRAGLDMGIVNAGQLMIYDELEEELKEKVEDVILNRREEATENLLEYAESMKGQASPKPFAREQASWRTESVEARLKHALLKGILDYIEKDIEEAIAIYPDPLAIIEGPLMDGMNIIGELFGAGKMFLPQVIKSARVMKKAVSFLTPLLQRAGNKKEQAASKKGKIILATVKGDVHDIGKNIVGVVLACNHFDVIDLGVMVPAEKILQAAKEEKADIIGLSGLITPSLNEMVHLAKEMQRQGFACPLLIGGATSSKLHTAVKIEPHYQGSTVHVLDASRSAPVAHQLLHSQSFAQEIRREYKEVREVYAKRSKDKEYCTLSEARKNKLKLDFSQELICKPRQMGLTKLPCASLDLIRPYIDWSPFFLSWSMPGKYPAILSHPKYGAEAQKLFRDANSLLDEIIKGSLLEARAAFYLAPANSLGDDIIVYQPEKKQKALVLHSLRQQAKKRQGEANRALADYIAPLPQTSQESSDHDYDYIGFFALSTGFGAEELAKHYEQKLDDYNSILCKALADRLAEAFAEHLHEEVRRKYWGYAPSENLSKEELIREKYRGIRPAPGYPAQPDHTEKESIFECLQAEKLGIKLTESMAMYPAASVSGIYFAHPKARYFGLGLIDKTQVEDYARRKNKTVKELERWLAPHLHYS